MQSRVQYTADGYQSDFTVPFDYLSKAHVHVKVGEVAQVLPPVWLNSQTLHLQNTPATGALVEIYRVTPREKTLVDFQDGSVLTADALDTGHLQNLFIIQELFDRYDSKLTGALATVAGKDGVVSVDPEAMLQEVTHEVLNSELLADLQGHIADIGLNGESIVQRALENYRSNELINKAQVTLERQNTDITSLLDSVAQNQAAIEHQETTFSDADGALADRIDTVSADLGENTAAIQQEATSRANADSAAASLIDLIGARSADGQAFIINTQTAYAGPGLSLADKFSVLSSGIGDNSAAIQEEVTNRVDADSALAQRTLTLEAFKGDASSHLQTHDEAIAGISAEHFVKTEVNGYVSGYGIYNDGTTSDFTILSDRFAVVQPDVPGGEAPVVPFVVGTIRGSPGIGVTGNAIIDGSIYADALHVNELSSVAAYLGTVTGGLFRTADSGFRVEIGTDDTSYPIWMGTGSKTANNAVFALNRDGELYAQGNIDRSSVTRSTLTTDSLTVLTAPGCYATWIAAAQTSESVSEGKQMTHDLGTFYAPDYDAGFYSRRLIHRKMDAHIDMYVNSYDYTPFHLQVSYDGGAWGSVYSQSTADNRDRIVSHKFRYTLEDNWNDTVRFRAKTDLATTRNMASSVTIYNSELSSHPPGSTGGGVGSADTGWISGGSVPPGGGSAGCVVLSGYTSAGLVGDTYRGQQIDLADVETLAEAVAEVGQCKPLLQPCVEFETANGCRLQCSESALIGTEEGYTLAPELQGKRIPTKAKGTVEYSEVTALRPIGDQWVMLIHAGDRAFWAGMEPEMFVLHHNFKQI